MKCFSPYHQKNTDLLLPCGQCVNCRIVRRLEWVTRLHLEAKKHNSCCFCTFTYNDDNLTYCEAFPTLVPSELTNFLKRLRYYLDGLEIKIRYFACGEYGDNSMRPHYHIIFFGIDEKFRDLIKSCWPHGFVDVLPLTAGGIEYVAGYCQKKAHNNKETYKRLKIQPEFYRSSIGMGGWIVEEVKQIVLKYKLRDIPKYIMLGPKNIISLGGGRKKIAKAVYDSDYWLLLKKIKCMEYQGNLKKEIIDSGNMGYSLKEAYIKTFEYYFKACLLRYAKFKRRKL